MKTAQVEELVRELRELREEVSRLRIAVAPRPYTVYVPWTPQPTYIPWYQTTTIPAVQSTWTVQGNNTTATLATTSTFKIGGGQC
jgi:hypothetical protein